MIDYRNAKLWVGDNQYLMKAVVKGIKELGIPEAPNNNQSQNAVSIFFSGEGWYYGFSSRDKQFRTSPRPEIQLTDILSILYTIPANIAIYVKDLSEGEFIKLQEYLIQFGHKWYNSDKVKAKSEMTHICWLYTTKALGWDRENPIMSDIKSYIFPFQLVIFNKVEDQYNGMVLHDYGMKQYSSVEIRDGDNNLIETISMEEANRRYPSYGALTNPPKVIIDKLYSLKSYYPSSAQEGINSGLNLHNLIKEYYKPNKQILNHELQRSFKTDTTATRGSAIRSYIDECQIATGQRYIGNTTCALSIEPKIEHGLLSNSILRSNHY